MSEHRERGAADSRNLILRCLDGVASDAETAELERLVASDPEIAFQLAQSAQLESNLEVVMRGAPGETAVPPPQRVSLRRPRAIWTAGAVAVAAAAALLVVWRTGADRGANEVPSPGVAARGTGDRPTPLRATQPPARAAGPPADPRQLHFADGSTALLGDLESSLETRLSTTTTIDLVLVRGSARFEVVPRPDRRFRVWVESTYVDVIGTIFTVERLASGARVSVERGVVNVVSGRDRMRMVAGATRVVAIGKKRAAVPKDEPGELLHASEAARRAGHSEQALGLLRRLVDNYPRDPRTPYAMFILGRVLLEELARPREAASAFAKVEKLDPKTPLVQDALAREVESWSRAGDLKRARQRAGAYLGRYPDGRRSDEVRRYSQME